MTLEKAIEHLRNLHHYWDCFANKQEANALELAIEALKYVQLIRDAFRTPNLHILPGETKE